jgi:hypothetical protein
MQISPLAQSTVPAIAVAPQASPPAFRSPARGEVGLLDLHGVGFFSIRDTLTGYGRAVGYDSLANARRAAYMLSRGAESPAAGVFQQGERYFVRALGALPGVKPHADAAGNAGVVDAATAPGALQLLHFEGNAAAHFAWVRDSRLVLMVDGATKIWTRDAHHQPPAA